MVYSQAHCYLFSLIVNAGDAERMMSYALSIGVSDVTRITGLGSAKTSILDALGLSPFRKEFLMMVVDSKLDNKLHERISKYYHLNKPNHGIAFSSPINRFIYSAYPVDSEGGYQMQASQEVIIAIINPEIESQVISAADHAGSKGATILSGQHYSDGFLKTSAGSDQSIILMVSEQSQIQTIVESIQDVLKDSDYNESIIFTLPVTSLSGLSLN